MKGFKDTTRVQYFKGGKVTDPVKNKTGGKNDPERGDYVITGAASLPGEAKMAAKQREAAKLRAMTGAASTAAERRAVMKKAEGGKVDMKQDKKAVASGVHKHERNMHPGKPLTRMQRGGGVPVAKSGPMIKGSSKC
jgi:hypothetical protein